MKHLLNAAGDLGKVLRNSHLLLFIDYDGTLTPIVDSPEEAVLPPQMKKILECLSATNRIKIVITTGRSLKQIKAFVGLSNVVYIGSHGLEIEGPDVQYLHPGILETRSLFNYLAIKLKSVFENSPGITVEEKTFTLSVHYGHAKAEDLEKNYLRLLSVAYPYIEKSQVVLAHAKKVWELRPAVEWNKASALLWFSGRFSASIPYRSLTSMYIGDDAPDEVCFKIMRHGGLGVRVTEEGDEPTHAEYYLRNPDELLEFLKFLISIKKTG